MKQTLAYFIKFKLVILILILSLIPVLDLLHYGLPPTHDGQNQVVRSFEFDKTLRDGNWYPIWAEDLNYTYGLPLFNYVYPLPNYSTSLIHVLGFNFIDTFKLSIILATLLGGVGSYFYGKERFGVWGGFLTSIFYTYAPYHLLDIYIRGSIGEVWALGLFPWGLLSLDNMVRKRNPRGIIIAGIVLSLIIFSHNILAVMFFAFSISYAILLVLLNKQKIKLVLRLLLIILISLLLSAVFFVPALLEQKYVVGLKIFNVLENFPEIYQLIIPSWGAGYSGTISSDQMSFQIGLANLFVLFLIIIGLIRKRFKNVFLVFFLVWFFILVFLITSYSSFFWQSVPLMQFFQFPWRFLSLVILCTSILAGGISILYKSKILYVFLILLAIFSTIGYAKAPYYYQRSDTYYFTHDNFIHGSNSIGDAFQTMWLSRQEKLPNKVKGAKLIFKNTTSRVYTVDSKTNKMFTFPIAYFPGWKAKVNGENVLVQNNQGLIGVRVQSGESKLELFFKDTSVRAIAKSISIGTFIGIVIILLNPSVIQYFYARRHR